MKKLFSYFIQGILLTAPIAITLFILYSMVTYIDEIVPVKIPGVGFAIVIVGITLLGFLSSTLIFRPIFKLVERLIRNTPLVKIIYTALKDLFSAFMGDKSRFRHPVLVRLNEENEIFRLGFITNHDLSRLGINDKVAVYFPHSYQISGNLYLVPEQNVDVIDGVSSTEVMKFIISGGVTNIHQLKSDKSDAESE